MPGWIPYSGEVHRYSLLVAGCNLPGFFTQKWWIHTCFGMYPKLPRVSSWSESVYRGKSRQYESRFYKWIAAHLSTIRDPSRQYESRYQKWIAVHLFTIRDPSRQYESRYQKWIVAHLSTIRDPSFRSAKKSENGLILHSKVWFWLKWEITLEVSCFGMNLTMH